MASISRYALILRLNLFLSFAGGMWVLWIFLRSPSEANSIVFIQYSMSRLLLIFIVLALLVGILFLLAQVFRFDWPQRGAVKWLAAALDRTETFWLLLLCGGIMYVLIFLSGRMLGSLFPYRERMLPMFVWFGMTSLHWLVSWLTLRWAGSPDARPHAQTLQAAGIFLGLLFLVMAFVAITGVGLRPDPIYWQNPGSPILLSQVFITVLAGLLFKYLIDRFGRERMQRTDALISISLWALAALVWLIQPARISYNSLEPGSPNYQTYPFGDALIFDTTAHDFLAGGPIPGDFWFKPLYTVFLALLHGIAGENYGRLLLFQIMILAGMPVMIYGIGKLMGSRTAGFIAGLLVIIRERNEMALSNVIQVSHLKLLLSDVFSMALVILLTWVLLVWLHKSSERRLAALVLGGVLGLLILTRGHAILLFPMILVVLIAGRLKRLENSWQSVILFLLGISLAMFPWFLRNYQKSGSFSLQDADSTYTSQMAGIYSLTPNIGLQAESLTRDASETDPAYYNQLRQQVVDFVVQHPDEVVRFISAHYFHNVVYSAIYLPHSFRIESLRSYVTTEPFWGNWQGGLSVQGWILLCLNLALIALGLGVAWRKHGMLSLVPLLIGVGYNASVSVGRISGWRFILPVDWITLVYYSLGIVQLFYLVGFLLTRREQKEASAEEHLSSRRLTPQYVQVMGYAIIFLLIGASIPYGDRLFTGRYPEKTAVQLTGEFIMAASGFSQPYSEEDLARFLEQDRARILYGQAIYPYYLETDHGPINHAWPAYKPRSYNRLVIYLSGPISTNVILPLASSDFTFPDGSDVIVIGCINDVGDIEALSILKQGDASDLYLREPFPDLTCPFPEPQ